MTFLDSILDPDRLLLVGVEDDAHGVRCYVIDRALGLHVHCQHLPSVALVRLAWATDPAPFIPAPTAALCDCPPPARPDVAPIQETADALA